VDGVEATPVNMMAGLLAGEKYQVGLSEKVRKACGYKG
jgi:hypothetical protein